jgi:hypothetical protein
MRYLLVPLALLTPTLTGGCVVSSVVGAAADVAGTAVKTTGAVVGATADAVTTSDDELRHKDKRRSQ